MALTFEKTFLIFFEKGSCKTLRIHKILRSYQTLICKSWLGKGTGTRAQAKLKKELIYSVCVGIVIVDHERLKGPHMGERHLCGPQRHQRSPRIHKRIKVLKYRLSEKRK